MTGEQTQHRDPNARMAEIRQVSWAARPFIGLIWAYRATLSPLLGRQCRYHPTCSVYGLEAYRVHGAWRGTILTARRILRCHPFAAGGYDPVPLRNDPK